MGSTTTRAPRMWLSSLLNNLEIRRSGEEVIEGSIRNG